MQLRRKSGRVLSTSHHLNGKSNLVRDNLWKAEPPGKRRSVSGKVYYEYRKNRADL